MNPCGFGMNALAVAIIVSALTAAYILTLIYGPDVIAACRDLFPRRPFYVLKAREHNAKRIAQTPRAHDNDAVRRARLELVTRLTERGRRIH